MTFRQMREAAKLTQEQLALAAGIDQTTVSQIETGKVRSPQYATVSSLAKALGAATDDVAAAIAESAAA
jgi:transcriptional regulator with XRE-family HTH domain